MSLMTASLKKLSAGDGVTYYTRQTAIADATDRGRKSLSDYYSEKGERPGSWLGRGVAGLGLSVGDQVNEAQMLSLYGLGRHPDYDKIMAERLAQGASDIERERATRLGQLYPLHDESSREMIVEMARAFREWNAGQGRPGNAPIPAEIRADLRSQVGREDFLKKYGRAPDERELHGHIARETRPAPKACAGYDITFTPVKSVSVLWAVADDEVTQAIEEAHFQAVRRSLKWLEDNALFTRRGARGVRQVEVRGAVASSFQHRDSRDGDPNLHTHVVIANKVQAVEDDAWLSVDGQAIYKSLVCVSERYNTELEVELNRRLGLSFVSRERADGKRPTREVVGIDERVIDAMSRRRLSIDQRRAELAASFQVRHGRPPSPIEAIQLAEQANLETRQDKHEPRSFNEQRAEWRVRIGQVLGGPAGTEAMVRRVREATARRSRTVPEGLIDELAERVLARVEASRARFQINHVRAEVDRMVRAENLSEGQTLQVREAVSAGVLARAIQISRPAAVDVPVALRRRGDGRSMYERSGSDLFTTASILEAEELVLAAARRTDGRRAHRAHVEGAIAAVAAGPDGIMLNQAQASMVLDLATSGARVQLALAPAGSGKTTAMRVLSQAWNASGGSVIGLAPSAVAATQLQAALGRDRVETLAKLSWELQRGEVPEWIKNVNEDTMIIVDESGMASTCDLAMVAQLATERGASVRLVGDDQQLAAIEAGGLLRDVKEEVGAVSLTELVRFGSSDEAAATLAVRDGDPQALGFYLDNGRIHLHDESTVLEAVYEAWKSDTASGLSSLMLAYSNETAQALNARARSERIESGTVAGPSTPLRGGLAAAAGDIIITRRNDRRLRITSTDFVKNGDLWDVLAVNADGSLEVRHRDTSRVRELPADYVSMHVDLGYAKTVHTAQGATVDTCHTAFNGEETRQLAYVALTRGRRNNHAYVFTAGDGDSAAAIDTDTIRPVTAGEVLERIIGRDGAQTSARTAIREASDPQLLLGEAHDIYRDAVGFAAIQLLPQQARDRILAGAEEALPGLTEMDGWDILLGSMALLQLGGEDPVVALNQAVAQREIDTARNLPAVLEWRLGVDTGVDKPLPWLTGIPPVLADDLTWGPYLARLGNDVSLQASALSHTFEAAAAETVPRWGVAITHDRALLADIAVWRSARHVPDSDLSPIGDHCPPDAAGAAHWHRLEARLHAAVGAPNAVPRPWESLLQNSCPHVFADVYWPVVGRRLDLATQAGINVDALLETALARGPLPDEHPASALWYRLDGTLTPVAADERGPRSARLRPPWTDALLDVLGEGVTDRIMRDPQWTQLVAHVTEAERRGLTSETLVREAAQSLGPDRIGHSDGLTHEEITTVLCWRVALLSGAIPVREMMPAEHEVVDELDHEIAAFLAESVAQRDVWQPRAAVSTSDSRPTPPPADLSVLQEDEGAGQPAPAATQHTPVARIIALNEMAATFWADQYHASKAADYVAARFAGSTLEDDSRFRLGYAPDSWTALTDHLRHAARATDAELVDAGLARYSRRGSLVDVFRNRVTLALTNTDGQVVGFSGRALPDSTDTRKYINTAETPAFHKGALLFGLYENRDQLAAGAVPTLTEGPFDAIAITLSARGQAVGLAPCGTALTQAQSELLAEHAPRRVGIGGIRTDRIVVVATDDDRAGRAAAEKDFWLLQRVGTDPRVLPLSAPDGAHKDDPAANYARDGGATIGRYLQHPDVLQTLAWKLLDAEIAQINKADHIGSQLAGLRRCAAIMAATPPERWDDDITAVAEKIDGDAWTAACLTEETLREAINWHSAAADAPLTDSEQAIGRLRSLQRRLGERGLVAGSLTESVSADLAARIRRARDDADTRSRASRSDTPESPTPPNRSEAPLPDEPHHDRDVDRER